ncbi:carbohydrate ABC transporter permease [Amnibacterium sp.]|uniref:carbohydrate ABC transporter permease n=1 Tax=Amnibacterium sp. TaxID=1872496 RepID=UPI003F7C9EDA
MRIRARRLSRRLAPAARAGLLGAFTLVVLIPVAVPVIVAQQQGAGGVLGALAGVLRSAPIRGWFGNSLVVCAATVTVAVLVGAPAGYVLSRARGRLVDAFALVVFALQALPTVLLVVPLFLLFIPLGLIDSLTGLVLLYVGLTAAVAAWTMAAAIDAVPVALEEAAWLDGTSVLGGFVRIVLPNALPGVLGTAVLTFLFAWNEYLVAVTFLTSEPRWTLALGVVSGRSGALGIAVMLPPLVVFAVLHRVFRFGGLAGAVTA